MSSYTVAAMTFQADQARMDAFNCLDRQHQEMAICRLAASGMTECGIAAATKLSTEMVRRILADHSLFNTRANSAHQSRQEI